MDLIEKVKEIINDNDGKWYLLKIEQPNITDPRFLVKQFRALQSSKSLGGMNNRRFWKRFVNGGFHVSYMKNDSTGVILIFIQARRELLDKMFIRHLTMRYHSSCRLYPKISLTLMKPTDEIKSLYQIMNKQVNDEIETVFDSGFIPKVRVVKFGCYHGTGGYKEE